MTVIECECGCKTPITPDIRGRIRRFIYGHQLTIQRIRFHPKKSRKAENHPSWKGGRKVNSQGYILIHHPNHPNCDNSGYVREHILVMEKYLGRYLTRSEVVHHIDHNKQNNSIENLRLYNSHRKHQQDHRKEERLLARIDLRNCLNCKSNTTYKDKNGGIRWYRYKNGYICSKCYKKVYREVRIIH